MKNKNLILFLIANVFIGISQSIDSSVFNNFLNDTFHLTISQRTILEIPREFPGFMVVFVSGLLLYLGDIRIASVANMLAALGMVGLGFISKDYATMIMWLTVYSMGQHLFMPVSNSIGMNLSDEKNMGKVLGKINGVNTAAFLVTSLLTALVFKYVKVNYKIAFLIGTCSYFISAVLIFIMVPAKKAKNTRKLFMKKRYKLFYILSVVHGARKQIFITFGPWVLIKIFEQGVSTFALLGFITAGVGILVKPLLGHLIDKKGERFVLSLEAVILFIICIGYAFSKTFFENIGIGNVAIYVVSGCFILDQVMSAAGMARATYIKKIAEDPEDVSPTLSMGITIDHAVAMFIPWIGGFIWNYFGYEYVFLGGSIIAVIIMMLTSKVKIDMNLDNIQKSSF